MKSTYYILLEQHFHHAVVTLPGDFWNGVTESKCAVRWCRSAGFDRPSSVWGRLLRSFNFVFVYEKKVSWQEEC